MKIQQQHINLEISPEELREIAKNLEEMAEEQKSSGDFGTLVHDRKNCGVTNVNFYWDWDCSKKQDTKNTINVGELKEAIKELPDEMQVWTSQDFSEPSRPVLKVEKNRVCLDDFGNDDVVLDLIAYEDSSGKKEKEHKSYGWCFQCHDRKEMRDNRCIYCGDILR